MIKMVTQTTSRVSDGEVINGDADDTKGMVATTRRDSIQVCVEMDVKQAQREGSAGHGGTPLRTAQRTATQATRQASEPKRKSSGSQAFETSCTEAAVNPGGARRLSFMST